MSSRVPNVLSIAGSDPSGGAGIQADLKTFAALGVYGCAALTALTAQNTVEVSAVLPVPADFLCQQLDAIFSDIHVDAVKIGMLGTAEAVRTVATALRAYRPPWVVLDPVLRATTGARLLDSDALDAVREELLPLATVVTPNAVEAGALLGITAPESVTATYSAAAALILRGAAAALVTGGHLKDTDFSIDVLHDGHEAREFRVRRVAGSAHGTGCTLSAAIAALLARGKGLPRACSEAQKFVALSILRGADLHVGHGAGPVHQLGDLWSRAARVVA